MIRTKLISFKPLKTGEVTIYVDKGVNLHDLVDMQGKEIGIDFLELAKETPADDDTNRLLDLIREYGKKQFAAGKEVMLESADTEERGEQK